MKKIGWLLLAGVMLIAMFAGCSKETTQTSQEASAPVTVSESTAPQTSEAAQTSESTYPYPGAVGKKATMILKDLTNPVWIQAKEGALAAAADFGMEMEVLAPQVSNNNDEQIALVQQVIATQRDILIMVPADSTGIVPAIEEINEAGIPVINLNTKINNSSGTANSETFVVADNTVCGTLCAEELVKLAGEEGEAIILEGPSGGQVTIDLSNAAQTVFAKYPNIKLVDIQCAEFDRSTGFTVTQNMLQAHPNLKIIFSCNDEMALGAVEALDEAGKLDSVFVGGIDGNQDALKAIRDGRMEVTVFKNFWLQAYTATEAAAKFLDGQKLEDLILVDLAAITKDNVEEYIQD
jgi:ABC-type sugar transport system substrate-binding protein